MEVGAEVVEATEEDEEEEKKEKKEEKKEKKEKEKEKEGNKIGVAEKSFHYCYSGACKGGTLCGPVFLLF